MSHRKTKALPKKVKDNLPRYAQKIFLEAQNDARKEYADPKKRRGQATREEMSRRTAWVAVRKGYRKDEKTGKWKRK
jgi:cation transport regulator